MRDVAVDQKMRLIATNSGPMKCATYVLHLETVKAPEFIDITELVTSASKNAGVNAGLVSVYSLHTTAAIKINESEPLLLEDMVRFLEHIAPKAAEYHHNDFSVRTVNMTEDECPNGHAHCQHLVLSSSETLPIVSGKPSLGPWQRIFLIELDRPRSREVMVQVIGV